MQQRHPRKQLTREYEEIQDQIEKEKEMEYNNYLEKLVNPTYKRNKKNLLSFIQCKGRNQIGTPPLQHNNRLIGHFKIPAVIYCKMLLNVRCC